MIFTEITFTNGLVFSIQGIHAPQDVYLAFKGQNIKNIRTIIESKLEIKYATAA